MAARDDLLAALAAIRADLGRADAAAAALGQLGPVFPAGQLRGLNLVGMEGSYSNFDQAVGPVAGTHYPTFPAATLDYYRAAGASVLRVLFSWERLQQQLAGPLPGAGAGYCGYLADLRAVVAYATGRGQVVVLEPWQMSSSGGAGGAAWRGQLVGSTAVPAAAFADFWARLAALFRDDPLVEVGLANEPNHVSTLAWFGIAQQAVDAIRAAGFAGRIHVPGNGWTGADSWLATWPDAAATKVSNAHGWMNANGPGRPLRDPLGKLLVEVHSYCGPDASGTTTTVASKTISRERVRVAVDWARANNLRVFLGEIGMYAAAPNAKENWADFAAYAAASADVLRGFCWWAGGRRGWWDDPGASGGGHFSVTPAASDGAGDTANMAMIRPALAARA